MVLSINTSAETHKFSPLMICKSLLLLAFLMSQVGCAGFGPKSGDDPLLSQADRPKITQSRSELLQLPSPIGVMIAAVYDFKDQTGQYKPSPSNVYSTAVTQGADTILVKALLDSKWFVPVERTALQNLLTERKIVKSSRAKLGNNLVDLPSVAPANVIIEGSIIAYDSNISSGGAGAKLLGIGGSETYREDQVTVNLRVVNIENGLVLHSINSTKKIFSRQYNSGVFGYIEFDKILELELGYSFNEPAQLCVIDAIESGLINLIAEGIISGTWRLKEPKMIKNASLSRFLGEKQITNYLQRQKQIAEQLKAEQIKAAQLEAEQIKAAQLEAEQIKAAQLEAEQLKIQQLKIDRQIKARAKYFVGK